MSVSVIIPVYNSRRFLKDAVKSVLDEASQVIVIDDGSTDGSLNTIRDLPVESIRFEQNRGPAAARNAGIKLAKHDKIAFLDSDDVLLKNGIARRSRYLDEHPGVMGVRGAVHDFIDERGQLTSFDIDLRDQHARLPAVLTWSLWKSGFSIPIPLIPTMLRRTVFPILGGFDETLRDSEDLDFFYRLLKRFDIPQLKEPIFQYRVHGNNLSMSAQASVITAPKRSEAQRLLVERAHGLR